MNKKLLKVLDLLREVEGEVHDTHLMGLEDEIVLLLKSMQQQAEAVMSLVRMGK